MYTNDDPKLQVAAKAVIINKNNEVLILRESKEDKNNTKVGSWGVAGGRLESGETFFDALSREILEETGLTAKVIRPLYVGEWRPVMKGVPHQIVALFMLCKTDDNTVTISQEHDDYKWISPKDASKYNIMEPDDEVLKLLRD